MKKEVTVDLNGRTLTIETGRLAKQAHGAVLVKFGESHVLATACAQNTPREGIDFFPLTVDYREYQYAAGRIPGGFFKREGRPSEKEIVTCRVIDRPLRPLFPEGFQNETQIIAMVLSADTDNDPDVLGLVGASAALTISDVPFESTIGGIRVGLVDGAFVANPTYEEQEKSLLNILIAATKDAIVMVEAGSAEVEEQTIVDALEFGHEQCRKIIAGIEELRSQVNPQKWEVEAPKVDQEYYQQISSQYREKLADACNTEKYAKRESYDMADKLKKELYDSIPEEDEAKRAEAKRYFGMLREEIFRHDVIENKRRPDGRAFDKVRQVTCEVGVLPRAHGSALFTRGETQALVSATLGTKEDVQRLDLLAQRDAKKRFMLHYNFPPFSVGEVKFLRGASRREIGHGVLAERALKGGVPGEDDFPYAVRIVSDILESNGSSSMATTCGGSLALMDAGVPVASQVAGIAMGLVLGEGGKYSILTDIAGAEDHYGDMDFKVTGTRKGITALQMDIKVAGITSQIMAEALAQAKVARLGILDIMDAAIEKPREEVSQHAPRIFTLQIDKEKIGGLIGPGGKIIRGIIDETGVKIDVHDDGKVNIFSTDGESAKAAIAMVEAVTATAEIGKNYLGKVVRLVDFGAFVEIFPGTDGLLHISEVAESRVENIDDAFKDGDQVMVKVISMDGNKVRLSRKAVLREQKGIEWVPEPASARPRGGGRDGGRGRGGGGRDRGPRDRDRGGRDRGPRTSR
jgi:polyribonucleotide nucleotidyltransferase